MKVSGRARQINVYFSDAEFFEGKPLADAIVERALEYGIDGATVLHGIEGFGRHHEIHAAKVRRFRKEDPHTPVLVVMVARDDRAEGFLTVLDNMVGEGIVTIEDVEMRFYRREED